MKTIKDQFNNLAMELIKTELKTNRVNYQITEHSAKFGNVSYTVQKLRATMERDVITFQDADNLLLESDYILQGFLFESVQAVKVVCGSPLSASITFANEDYIVIEEVA